MKEQPKTRKEFHDVMSFDEAITKYYNSISLESVGTETIDISESLNRILAEKIIAKIDVPPFARSSKDGYAVNAKDTFEADEEHPIFLNFNKEFIAAGSVPKKEVKENFASEIATGAMIPRGSNAVVMIEYADIKEDKIKIYRPVTPGENIMHAGSDMMAGELLIDKGQKLSSRETAVIATQGINKIKVFKKPKIGVISTGNEIIEVGKKLTEGKIYDTNARIVCDFCKENGANPTYLGIVKDNEKEIKEKIKFASKNFDMIILSGGTSAGIGDICYRVIEELGQIIVHGVAIKPGKPIVLGKVKEIPTIILPGFPTSASITFNMFVKPIVRAKSGLPKYEEYKKIIAKVAERINSEGGKHEFILVNLAKQKDNTFSAYQTTKNSGAITTFSFSDGFIEIKDNTNAILKDETVEVNLFNENTKISDLTFIGSHCVMLEPALAILRKKGFTIKILHVGSSVGLDAARREESDISPTHLLDEKSNEYNIAFIKNDNNLTLYKGYIRKQGIVFRKDIKHTTLKEFISNKNLRMINRNKGSGTRVLFDKLLKDISLKINIPFNELKKIKGYELEANTHSAVAAAVAQKKADFGIAIETVAEQYGLSFIPLKDENYDFCIPKSKLSKPAIQEFLKVIKSKEFVSELQKNKGIEVPKNIGEKIYE
jgi:putative molybdopterin biosynthesis protein